MNLAIKYRTPERGFAIADSIVTAKYDPLTGLIRLTYNDANRVERPDPPPPRTDHFPLPRIALSQRELPAYLDGSLIRNVAVYLNGLRMRYGPDADYIIIGDEVQFNYQLRQGDDVIVELRTVTSDIMVHYNVVHFVTEAFIESRSFTRGNPITEFVDLMSTAQRQRTDGLPGSMSNKSRIISFYRKIWDFLTRGYL